MWKQDLQGTGVEIQETRLGDPRGDPKGRDNVEFSSSCFDGSLKVQLANGAGFRLQRFEEFRGADAATYASSRGLETALAML